MPRSFEERRDDVRFAFDCPVTISTGGAKRRARVVDLSCGGARIGYMNSRMVVPSGAHRLRIEPDGEAPIELVALPVWKTRFSYGVKFVLAGEMERLAVAELMDRRATSVAA